MKAIKITYFVHGTTTDNEKDIATGWAPGTLSSLGIKQAKELGKIASKQKFDVVFCSDLKRAVDSANLGVLRLAALSLKLTAPKTNKYIK